MWGLTLVATLTMAVSYVDRQALSVLAPTVTTALDISEQNYGWLVAGFSLAYLVGSPLAGRMIDIVGARRGLLGAVLTWSAIAALHALTPGFAILFTLRILLGLAESPSFPGATQTIHRALPPHERARGYGILFTGASIGAMIVPPIATQLNSRYGWRIAMLLTAFFGLLWVPLWLAVAWNRRARQRLDVSPAPANAAPVESLGWRLWIHPAVLRAMVLVLTVTPLVGFSLNWSSKYLVRDRHLQQADVGSILWLPPLLYDVGALLAGYLATRAARSPTYVGGPRRLLVAVFALLGACGAIAPFARGVWPAMFAQSVALCGAGGLLALLTADMLARVPRNCVSTAGGITAAAQSLAYIVANPLIGRAVERSGNYTGCFIALALLILPGAAIWIAWTPPPPTGEPG